jgi:hypothetical protein
MGNIFNFKNTVDVSKISRLLGKSEVLIGFPEGLPHPVKGSANSLDEDELARIQTYGTATTPARPFLEEGIYSKKIELGIQIEKYNKDLCEGKSGSQDLKRIGAFCVGAVKEFVYSDFYKHTVPNAQSTIDQKSHSQKGKTLLSDKPLIDTANMINACTYVIRQEGQGEGEIK